MSTPLEIPDFKMKALRINSPQQHTTNAERFNRQNQMSPTSFALQSQHMADLHDEMDKKDQKAMEKLMKSTLPQFSNEQDWEVTAFELTFIAKRISCFKLNALQFTFFKSNSLKRAARDADI
jgi:hypothetical protein